LAAYPKGIRKRSADIVQEELTKSDQSLQQQLKEIQSSQQPVEEELRQLLARRPELLEAPRPAPRPAPQPRNEPNGVHAANGAEAPASVDPEQTTDNELLIDATAADDGPERAADPNILDLASSAPLKASMSRYETTAKALQRFGDWKAERRSLDGAESYYREALELFRDIYGAGAWNPDIANALQCLGTVNYHRNDLESAEELYMDALKMKRSVYGEKARNIDIAETLNWLGNVQRDRKNLESAEQLFQEALYMKRDVHGFDTQSADIAGSVHNLGTVKEGRKDYEGAEKLYREALAMKRHVYGEGAKNTDIARTLYCLGVVLEMRYDLGSARNSYSEALQMCKALDDSKDSDNGGVIVPLNAQAKVRFAQESSPYHVRRSWILSTSARLPEAHLECTLASRLHQVRGTGRTRARHRRGHWTRPSHRSVVVGIPNAVRLQVGDRSDRGLQVVRLSTASVCSLCPQSLVLRECVARRCLE